MGFCTYCKSLQLLRYYYKPCFGCSLQTKGPRLVLWKRPPHRGSPPLDQVFIMRSESELRRQHLQVESMYDKLTAQRVWEFERQLRLPERYPQIFQFNTLGKLQRTWPLWVDNVIHGWKYCFKGDILSLAHLKLVVYMIQRRLVENSKGIDGGDMVKRSKVRSI